MSYAPPLGTLDASWVGAEPYAGSAAAITGSWAVPRYVAPPAIVPPALPSPVLLWDLIAAPPGVAPGEVAARAWVLREEDFLPAQGVLSASWVGASPYTEPNGNFVASWGEGFAYITPSSIDESVVPAPSALRVEKAIVSGWESLKIGRAYVIFPWEYAPPEWTLDASWVGRDAYDPPVGLVNGQWALPSESSYISTVGWNSVAVGLPKFERMLEYVAPSGFQSLRVGDPEARNASAGIFTQGIASTLAFGATAVNNFDSLVFPSGLNAFRGFGEHWVSLGIRRITAGLGAQTEWGTAEFAGGVRWLDLAGRGIASATYGKPTVWFYERQVFPTWFIATRWGGTRVDFNHDVEPAGIAPGDFGIHEVHRIRFIVDLQQQGIRGPLWGESRVDNAILYIKPVGFTTGPSEAERFGRPEVFLWVRYLLQQFEVTPSDGGVFGNFNYVDNRNKYPRPEGFDMADYGLPEVRNNARVLRTPAYQDFSLWGDAMVSHSTRYLQPAGVDATLWGSPLGTIVYNGARLLQPAGWDSLVLPQPEKVWSNLQWFDHVGGVDSAALGVPMVAFRVRTVQPFPYPDPPKPSYASVQLWERYVEPAGLDSARAGVPTLEERFTIVVPAAILPPSNQVGDSARVWNLTPEVRTNGANAIEWGATHVHNEWEAYAFQGFGATIFGHHVVRDRRSFITPEPIRSLWMGAYNEVRNVIPDPPPTRTISPAGREFDAYGLPAFNYNTVYTQGDVHVDFGTAKFVLMGIAPVSILPPYDEDAGGQFGIPNLPAAQYISPKDEYNEKPWTEWGDAALWPHYIWAPRGYPYATGKDQERGHIMDYYVHGINHPERPVFGTAAFTHFHRTITHRHDTGDYHGVLVRWGLPYVTERPQFIRTEGTRHTRYGVPRLNDKNEVNGHGFDMALYGEPVVERGPYTGPQTFAPAGLAPGAFGPVRVEFFNREVAPSGFVALSITGTKPPGAPSWPQLWTWVSHQYDPFPFPGFDAALWGETWVSFKIRHIYPAGTDTALVAAYEPGWFADRMRVRRDNRLAPATGGDTALFGAATVELALRAIWPRTMIPRRPPAPVVLSVNTVEPTGWASAAFGDIDRWEVGKIKAHGDDLAALGRAVLHRALRPAGFAGDVGEPRIGQPLAPAGFRGDGMGDPAAIARWCGNKALAARGADHGAMGVPTLTA